MLAKLGLITSTLAYILEALYAEIRRQLRFAIIRRQVRSAINPPIRDRNIVVIGASFAGYHAASVLARGLPADSRYRVIVVEPHTHFHFTWVLPRFVVVPGHEHKAFVPYGGYVSKAPKDGLRWVKDWVDLVEEGQGERKGYVALRSSGERIPYDFLVVATGSGIKDGLPSRVNETEKFEGIKLMQEMQRGIREAQTIVVVGGGASGVEVATDAKCLHPAKRVVLVHSRNALMHRFGIRLQDAALQGCESLGVEVMLNDRVISHDPSTGLVTLKSGLTIHCDKYINCAGQKPCSEIIARLCPSSIAPSGAIKVRPTLQIDHEGMDHIYACGDVADTQEQNPNARSASFQATIVAENIIQATEGRPPRHEYKSLWIGGVIQLTLGLKRAVNYISNGKSDLMFTSNNKDMAQLADRCWKQMGEKPFDDPYMEGKET